MAVYPFPLWGCSQFTFVCVCVVRLFPRTLSRFVVTKGEGEGSRISVSKSPWEGVIEGVCDGSTLLLLAECWPLTASAKEGGK